MKKYFIIITLFTSLYTYSFNKQVTVHNVKEFFKALDNNTEIIVECETLNFTRENLEVELDIQNFYEHWTDDEPYKSIPKSYYIASGIILNGYENLTIRSVEHTNIISNNEADRILTFKNCKRITLEGFSIYHTPATCNGAVLSILLSNNVFVNNCNLNGSGGIGANLIGADNITFNNVQIFNNVFYGIYAVNTTNTMFKDCDIYDNHDWGESLIYSDRSNLTLKNCSINNNQSKKLVYSFLKGYSYINFKNCIIEENTFGYDNKNYINVSSNKEEHKKTLELFMKYLQQELGSDHDNHNNEFISFFIKNYKIVHKNGTSFDNFLSFYYGLKKKQIKTSGFKVVNNNNVIVNKDKGDTEVWHFYFTRKNKIKKIDIK
ncbi:right-handed parallel beta-helix repeat-containing protein [Aquimarina algiphila]|uniref:right-handed parallel beta-helix repeat-containing protein n=1 Tax=Aquimarina algiphila TaxID=2047982 RepID=UPI00249330C6|nr:right-handed parallel beta-helix repeat-containing protein [Aquimarina algiphila]